MPLPDAPIDKDFLIVALDVETPKEAKKLIKELGGKVQFYKIGGSLYYNRGWEVIDFLAEEGKKIFLDLKLYDIPNTVKNTCRQFAKMNIDMVTVHLSGGVKMLEAAKEGLSYATNPIDLIGVSVLTSFSEKDWCDLHFAPSLLGSIEKLCAVASDFVDGYVCSPHEISIVKKYQKKIITPGIRLEMDTPDDQKRVMTPDEALMEGSSHIVMGRSILEAKSPLVKIDVIWTIFMKIAVKNIIEQNKKK